MANAARTAANVSRNELVAAIHRSPVMAVLVVTGGGVPALADLFAVPGASRTVLEALVPYSDRSMGEFLGYAPAQAVSVETAAALARKACARARSLRPSPELEVLGVACTAALVTDRPRKGAHRAHFAVCRGGSITGGSLTLEKNARTRAGEERVVADVLLSSMGRAAGVPPAACDAWLPQEPVQVWETRDV